MKRPRLDRILAIDTEWTCWEGEPPPGMSSEPIEIGLVEADAETMGIVREERFLIRPDRSSVSDFCTGLTGLTQAELVREGRPFIEVMSTISKQFGPGSKLTLAWGDDWGALDAECERRGRGNPFPRENALNLGGMFTILAGGRTRVGQAQALEMLGLGFEGERHRAVDDARSAMRVYLSMAGDLRARISGPAPGSPGPR